MKPTKFSVRKELGLVFYQKRLSWGYKHGAFRWAPEWLKSSIVWAWNHIACFIVGHEPFGPIIELDENGDLRQDLAEKHCIHCCKQLALTNEERKRLQKWETD